MGQINSKLKKIIFDRLNKELSHVEIINYENSIWFIDRKEKYWYFEFEKNGKLWWRYGYIVNFFHLFSMKRSEFEPIIIEWVEEVLNSKVVSTATAQQDQVVQVEEVLNSKVVSTEWHHMDLESMVEEVLNSKVVSTAPINRRDTLVVEEVLNSKVTSTFIGLGNDLDRVEEVLKLKVVSSRNTGQSKSFQVEEVLNSKVKSIDSYVLHRSDIV